MVKITEVVAVEVGDRPGGLVELLNIVEECNTNVEYMYAFTEKHKGRGILVFCFEDPDAAIEALQSRNINVVESVELFNHLAQA